MTKKQMLDLIKLLSALESWGLTAKERFPDYLHENLCNAVDALSKEVLNDNA